MFYTPFFPFITLVKTLKLNITVGCMISYSKFNKIVEKLIVAELLNHFFISSHLYKIVIVLDYANNELIHRIKSNKKYLKIHPKTHNNMTIVRAIDNSVVLWLIFLNIRSEFGMVERAVLLEVLEERFRAKNSELEWFLSYLSG